MKQKNPIKEAVALHYDETQHSAPIVIAKGKGETAEKILHLAKENHIPIQEDASLVQILSQLNINDSIPEELYQVVAEIFSFIYKIDKKLSDN